jgi:hypothetical protein
MYVMASLEISSEMPAMSGILMMVLINVGDLLMERSFYYAKEISWVLLLSVCSRVL